MHYPDFCWATLLRIIHSLPQSISYFHLALQYHEDGSVTLPQDDEEHAGFWKEVGGHFRRQRNFKKITITLYFSEHRLLLQPSLVDIPQAIEAELINSGLSGE